MKKIEVEISEDVMFATCKGMLKKVEMMKQLDVASVNGK